MHFQACDLDYVTAQVGVDGLTTASGLKVHVMGSCATKELPRYVGADGESSLSSSAYGRLIGVCKLTHRSRLVLVLYSKPIRCSVMVIK